MSFFERLPLWWDRETDHLTGVRLRPDVREAAHRVWKCVCLKSRELLDDAGYAAEVLEGAVRAISRYLDRREIAHNATDPAGLLVLACYRSLRRLARRTRRIELVGATSELAEVLRAPDWLAEVDRRLFVEELARELDPRTRGILRLRITGYDWNEIGRIIHMSPSAARTAFWREVRRGHLRLLAGKHTFPDRWYLE